MAWVSTEAGPSIDSLLLRSAQQHPAGAAVAYGGDELSYRELNEAVDRLAERMLRAAGGARAAGDLQGARIAVIAPNAPALVIAMFAAWRLGAVAVPLNARFREHELSRILSDAEPFLVLSVPAHLGYAFTELLPRLVGPLPSVRACLFVGPWGEVEEDVRGPHSASVPEPLGPPIGAILYTSGTTGVPKGALVTRAREVEGAPRLGSVLGLAPRDSVAFVIPISHAFGLTCLLGTVAVGACAVLVERTFSLGPLLDALDARRPNVLHGSPSLFASLLKARPGGLPSVRTGFVGGAPSQPELLEQLDRAGMRILNIYGLTETGAVSCCRPEDQPDVRYTTAGQPLPGFELRIAAEDAASSIGELQIRGAYVTPGYFRRPAETDEAFADGWFRTGDLAAIDDGHVRIAGREKELIHVGGFNVFPAEVEAVLLSHPDVVQAAVVGVRDDRVGEVVQAFVVARAGSDLTRAALLQFARDRIAGYKLPYAIRILPELPLLPSGKPDRRALVSSGSGPAASRVEV